MVNDSPASILFDVEGNPIGSVLDGYDYRLQVATKFDTNLKYPSNDSSGRIRVSETFSLFDTVHQYDASPLFWDTISVGSGSISSVANQSAVQLSVGTTSGDSIKFQTHNYFRYQPGKSQLIYLTGVFGAKTTNLVRRIGYYDDSNGIFLEITGTDIAVVRRTFTSGAAVDNRITQSNWNLDTLDGSGNARNPSGALLDVTKLQLMFIDFQWLSAGIIRWGFQIGESLVYVHMEQHTNILTAPYMTTANLPIRYELTNIGITSGTNTLLSICSSVMSEGGQQIFGYPFGANTGTTGLTVAAANVPLISIRPALTFNSIVNRGLIQITNLTAVSDQILLLDLWLNPTLTSASFANIDGTNSIAQIDTSATALTGGIKLFSTYIGAGKTTVVSQTDVNLSKKLLSLNAAGSVGDILTVTLSKCGTNSAAFVAIDWIEFR